MNDKAERHVNKWIVALTVMLPTLIEILDTSIVNVSLDHIRGSFSAGMGEATWAISSYLLSNAIVIPMSGWFSRLFGRKRYQIGSIAMAKTVQPDSAGSQFFIITGSDGAALPPEYALFGQVTDGLESTVAAMAAAGTPDDGVPSEPIEIQSVRIVEA